MNNALPVVLVIVYIVSVFACVALVTTVVLEKVSADPYSAWTPVFVTSAGFALVPVLNTLVVIGIVIALASEQPRAD